MTLDSDMDCDSCSPWLHDCTRGQPLGLRVLQAIKLNGTVLGLYPLRVMQSKTAIVPVNTEFLPRTQVDWPDERLPARPTCHVMLPVLHPPQPHVAVSRHC